MLRDCLQAAAPAVEAPKEIFRKDYTPTPYLVEKVHMDFNLNDETRVITKSAYVPNYSGACPAPRRVARGHNLMSLATADHLREPAGPDRSLNSNLSVVRCDEPVLSPPGPHLWQNHSCWATQRAPIEAAPQSCPEQPAARRAKPCPV